MRKFFNRPAILAALIGLTCAASAAVAQTRAVLVVGNDRGGLVGARAQEIESLRALGHRVEIRGDICYSACTMYLGAGDVCVSPDTTFGFHGPSRNGQALPPDQFDHWSRVMARFYNAPLQSWFMNEGRYEQADVYRFSGAQLIEMGYPRC